MPGKPPDPLDLLIGRNIRFYRLRRGLSQSALARAIGVTYQQVQKYERGLNRISAAQLYRAATALGVPIPILFEIKSVGC
ncbi:helix-turn-helix domain-containing protein [Rhodoplanes sp. SY1]|uniref:helix-turn-helix domain-containing protein n=1 Tax=Rhodoplanes sp. SY1 TaxID=3166646 RepID=UPI0038B446C3